MYFCTRGEEGLRGRFALYRHSLLDHFIIGYYLVDGDYSHNVYLPSQDIGAITLNLLVEK